jgi:prolyl-tRNA synthetase
VAPKQIVIVPMLRGKPEDGELKEYCAALARELNAKSVFGAPLRAHVDLKDAKPTDKRWDWVRRGAPIVCEIGPRDAANGQVSFVLRNALRDGEKIKTNALARDAFIAQAPALLEAAQKTLFEEARARLRANITDSVKTFADLQAYYSGDDDTSTKGWVRAAWSKPAGAALDRIGEQLKTLKLTIRNAPLEQPASFDKCLFTGAPGVQQILIGRAY